MSRSSTSTASSCHDEDEKKGGLALDTVARHDVAQHPDVWEKVVRKLRARQMPPVGEGAAGRCRLRRGGRVRSRRRSIARRRRIRIPAGPRRSGGSRAPSIRTPSAICSRSTSTSTSLLPADESSYGFDNVTVGDLSPTLLDRYISAAEKISRLAVGRPSRSPGGDTIRIPPDLTQEEHLEGLPIGTRGGAVVPYTFPLDGEYEIQIRLTRDRDEHVEGLSEPHELELLLDGQRVQVFTVKPPQAPSPTHATRRSAPQDARAGAGRAARGRRGVPEEAVAARSRRARQPYQAHFNSYRHPRIQPAIYSISIIGPYGATGARRHAQPPADLRVAAGGARPGRTRRHADPDAR